MNANFLQDNQGNSSSTRLLGAMVYTVVMAAWGFMVIHTGTLPELPQTILGLMAGASVWLTANKHIETNAPKESLPATPIAPTA